MANPPRLQVSNLPSISAEEAAATTSPPARGREMLSFLNSRLNQKNRAPPLVHTWDFWHDRQTTTTPSSSYIDRLEPLAQISDVRQFWSVFNNFPLTSLPLRDSIHLFHTTIKPIWEDPRNIRGGAWTFRVPKALAPQFFTEICMMAIGEQLQAAVEDPKRTTFRDDICGVSLSVRFNSMLVQVWNRDSDHSAGIEKLKETVLEGLSEELRPKEGSFYYKKHSEHAGFGGKDAASNRTSASSSEAQS